MKNMVVIDAIIEKYIQLVEFTCTLIPNLNTSRYRTRVCCHPRIYLNDRTSFVYC